MGDTIISNSEYGVQQTIYKANETLESSYAGWVNKGWNGR